jgi:NitT/TauT family transport system substrate-binding protein
MIRQLRVLATLLALATTAFVLPAKSNALTKVRLLETTRNVLFAPYYAAVNRGFFRDEGLDVSISTAQGTDKATAALLGGSADIMLVGPEAAIYVQASRSPVKVKMFASLTATDGTFLIARNGGSGPFDWNSLRGKSIVGLPPGSTPGAFLDEALRKHGLDPNKDVNIIKNIGPPARLAAFSAGTGDFAQLFAVEAATLEKKKTGTVVAPIGQIVGRLDYTQFTATDEFIAKNKPTIQAWTNTIAKALRWVETTPDAEVAAAVAPSFPGIPEDVLTDAIRRSKAAKLWKETPVIDVQSIDAFQTLLIKGGVLKEEQRVPAAGIVDNSFAEAAVAAH